MKKEIKNKEESVNKNWQQELMNHIPAGIGIVEVFFDGTLNLVYLNDGYYATIGKKREERTAYMGMNMIRVVHEDDRDLVVRDLLTAVDERRQFKCECRIMIEGDAYQWFHIQGNEFARTDDKVSFYCVFTDVNQLKLSQLRLAEEGTQRELNAQMMRSILHNLPGAVASFLVDRKGIHLCYLSDGCHDIIGYSAKEVLHKCKKDAFFFTHPDDVKEVKKKAVSCAKKCESFMHDLRLIHKDKSVRWVRLRLTPVREGDVVHYYGVYQDISEQHEAELLQKKLIDSLPGGVVIYQIAENIKTIYYSEGILRLSGHTKEEYEELVKDDPIHGVVYQDDIPEMLKRVTDAVKKGAPITMTYRLVHRDGSLVWVQLSATVIEQNKDEKLYYAIFTRLSQESEIYKNVAENTGSAIFIAERSTRKLIFANKAWKKLRELPIDSYLVGQRLPEVIPPQDVLFSDEELKELPDDQYVESHVVTSKGQHLDVFARTIDWGGYDAYVCYIMDETRLENSRRRLQQIINRIPGGISIYKVTNDEIQLTYVNDAYRDLLGDVHKLQNRNTLNYIHPDDRSIVSSAIEQLRQGESLFDIHFRTRNTSGGYMWIRMVGSVVERHGSNLVVYCCYSDFELYMKSQNELVRNRAMLDAAMKSAKVIAWRYDYRTRTITDSASLGQFIGLPKVVENAPEAILQMGLVHDISKKDFLDMFDEMESETTSTRDICSYEKGTNRLIWHRQIYTPVYNRYGEYVESIGTAIDVTEQKERENHYEEEIRVKQLITNNVIAVSFFNLTKNRIIAFDSKEEELLAVLKEGTADDILTRISQRVLEQDIGDLQKVMRCQALVDGYKKGECHYVFRHHLVNDIRWVESVYDIIANPYTGDIEAIATLHDVSDIAMTEEIIKKLMDIDYESITTIRSDTGEARPLTKGHLDDVIEEQKKLGDNVKGVESYLRHYCDDRDIERVIRETSLPYVKEQLEQKRVHMVTYSLRIGEESIHKRVIYSYLDREKMYILCAMQDTTETYKNELEQKIRLSSALQEAEQASHAKSDFFSRMSHDMRTPMNGILGLAGLSVDETSVEELRKSMRKILETGGYLLSLINDTLDWQRIESGKLKLENRVIHAQMVLDSILDIVRPSAKAKNIQFTIINDNVSFDWYVRTDPVRMKQIFINILSNAIKFTPEGGMITFRFHCISREGKISHNCIQIQDTGIGMSNEFIQNGLFEPFQQEQNQVKTEYTGSGLGMSIVKRVVDLMGGKIEVSSQIGMGTMFTIFIDFERVPMDEVNQRAQSQEIKEIEVKNVLKGKSILIVEDNALNAQITERMLKKMECIVQWAENGEKAIKIIQSSSKGKFDAILMDVRMPVMNGLDATRAIRKMSRDDVKRIPIIAMTANAYEEDVQQCIEAGMNQHLAKPFRPIVLYETLGKHLH